MKDKKELFRYFFLAAFALLIYQIIRIFSVFLIPITVAIILAVIFYPLYKWYSRRVRSSVAASAFTVVTVTLLTILPFLSLGTMVTRQSSRLYPVVKDWTERYLGQDRPLSSLLPPRAQDYWMLMREQLELGDFSIRNYLFDRIKEESQSAAQMGAKTLTSVAFFVFDILVLLFTLFFLFKDGKRMVERLIELIPMEPTHKAHIAEVLYTTFNAVIRGLFITAAVQGILAGIGYAIAGLAFPVMLGFLTAFMAIFPIGGALAVWGPSAAYLFFTGQSAQGLFLAVWGLVAVSLPDNVLRPLLIGDKAKLPLMFLFFGILGGLQLYGFLGILLGPLLIACAMAFTRIYREDFQGLKEKE